MVKKVILRTTILLEKGKVYSCGKEKGGDNLVIYESGKKKAVKKAKE